MDATVLDSTTRRGSGTIETLILLSIKDNDKHSNQIKEFIQMAFENEYQVKHGTFYTALKRLLKQNKVSEYRSSSIDGIRCKYYKLTDIGKDQLNIDYKKPELTAFFEKINNFHNNEKELTDNNNSINFDNENRSINMDADSQCDVDFDNAINQLRLSSISSEENLFDKVLNNILIKSENIKENAQNPNQIETSENEEVSIITDNTTDFEDNYKLIEHQNESIATNENIESLNDDSLKINGKLIDSFSYKSVLDKLFSSNKQANSPKDQAKENTSLFEEQIENIINKQVDFENTMSHQTPVETKKNKSVKPNAEVFSSNKLTQINKSKINNINLKTEFDFSDLHEMAEREGFKIRTSHNNYANKNYECYLTNKLTVYSCLTHFLLFLIQSVICIIFLRDIVDFATPFYISLAVISFLFPFVSSIIYFINPTKNVQEMPTYSKSIELTILLTVQLVIVMFSILVLLDIDFTSKINYINYLIMPVIIALNFPIHFIIRKILLNSKSTFYYSE